MKVDFEQPDWPAPDGVKAIFTHRRGGYSEAPFVGANLGLHVGDRESDVQLNRALLLEQFRLPSKPAWMTQIHSGRVLEVSHQSPSHKSIEESAVTRADGAYTKEPGLVLAMMVADCLPILLVDDSGREIAVLHAGWRGLADSVIYNGVKCFSRPVTYAWIGPAIGPCHFEVGHQVIEVFSQFPDAIRKGCDQDHWFVDLRMIARIQLEKLGVKSISVSNHCTYCEENDYFSARRDGVTGRMACLIWRE